MHCIFKTGQDVCKWLAVPWVTASQEQLLEEGVPKGFFPGSNPCGGCKNMRLSLACIPSYGPFKPTQQNLDLVEVAWRRRIRT